MQSLSRSHRRLIAKGRAGMALPSRIAEGPACGRRPLCLGKTGMSVTPKIMRGWMRDKGFVLVNPKRELLPGPVGGRIGAAKRAPGGPGSDIISAVRNFGPHRDNLPHKKMGAEAPIQFRRSVGVCNANAHSSDRTSGTAGCGVSVQMSRTKKWGPKPPSSFAVQAQYVNRPVLFCLRPERRQERTHPPRKRWGDVTYRPTRLVGDRINRSRPGPLAPHFRGAYSFSYTRTSRRRCCTSCRCRCAPVCSCRIRRRLRLHNPASWPWCVHPC